MVLYTSRWSAMVVERDINMMIYEATNLQLWRQTTQFYRRNRVAFYLNHYSILSITNKKTIHHFDMSEWIEIFGDSIVSNRSIKGNNHINDTINFVRPCITLITFFLFFPFKQDIQEHRKDYVLTALSYPPDSKYVLVDLTNGTTAVYNDKLYAYEKNWSYFSLIY